MVSMKDERQQRVRLQSGIISVVSAALIVFVVAWLINTAVTGRKYGLTLLTAKKAETSASQSETGKKKSSKKKKDSSAVTDTESKADSLPEQVIPSDSSDPSSQAAVYEGAAMKDDFSDACFIGDSRTVGLELNSDKAKADFYASQGLNISSALTDQVVTLDNGNMGTVIEGAAQKPYSRIFIMFGINELGWPSPETFVADYVDLITQVKAVQPDAQIYIQSVLPVSAAAVNENEVFTNDNIDSFNENFVKQVAAQTGTTYLDINTYFKDASGMLPEDAAADGIHFTRDYCLKWIDLLAYLVPTGENV